MEAERWTKVWGEQAKKKIGRMASTAMSRRVGALGYIQDTRLARGSPCTSRVLHGYRCEPQAPKAEAG